VSITSAPVSRRRSSASRFVVGRHRDAVPVTARERRRDRPALDLGEHARRAAVEQSAAGHDHEVGPLGERAVGDQRRAERRHHALGVVERDERDLERRAAARGVAQQLVRAERVEVVEAVEDEDVDLHGWRSWDEG
jgi:hypothetical protein